MTTAEVYRDPSRPIAERVTDLLARMTIAEKVAQLGSAWFAEVQSNQVFSVEKAAGVMGHGIGEITRLGGGTALDPQSNARMANAIQAFLVNHTRLGIPALMH